MDNESYRRGWEDALELCLSEIQKIKTLNEARIKARELLGLIKEDKIERLKEMLWMIGR